MWLNFHKTIYNLPNTAQGFQRPFFSSHVSKRMWLSFDVFYLKLHHYFNATSSNSLHTPPIWFENPHPNNKHWYQPPGEYQFTRPIFKV